MHSIIDSQTKIILCCVFCMQSNTDNQHVYSQDFLYCFFGVFRPTQDFFTRMEMSSLPVKGSNFFYLCSTLMAIEQWGFFSVPHLLWHGASVYNGYTLDTHTDRLAVELSLPGFKTSKYGNKQNSLKRDDFTK